MFLLPIDVCLFLPCLPLSLKARGKKSSGEDLTKRKITGVVVGVGWEVLSLLSKPVVSAVRWFSLHLCPGWS